MPLSKLLYYNMMTPAWLQNPANQADFRNANKKQFNDLSVAIGTDTLPYERIGTVPLVPGEYFKKQPGNLDITVKIVVGLELPDTLQVIDGRTKKMDMPTKPTDPIAFMLSDGSKAIGMVIQDVTKEHDIVGPYYGIQAEVGPRALSNVNTKMGSELVRTTSKNNPDEFRLTIKPKEYWGEAYSAIDGGHKTMMLYNTTIDLTNGLYLQICRVDKNGTFKINFVEVTIYETYPDKPPC